MKTLKTVLLLAILGISLLAVGACRQTLRGAGEDIEKAGEKIQDSSR